MNPTIRDWLARPVTRAERLFSAAVTTFCGFWLGVALTAIAYHALPTAHILWPMWIGATLGAIAGCILGWVFPKQTLSVLGARALFRP